MPILVTCGGCGATLKAPAQLAGRNAKCRCGTVVSVPAAAPVATAGAGSGRVNSHGAATRSGLLAPSESSAIGMQERAAAACPGCMVPLVPGAVICVTCGFNLKTGKRMSGVKQPASTAAAGAASPKAAAKKQRDPSDGPGVLGALTGLIKPLLILGALGGVGWFAFEMFQFDVVKQGKDKLAALGIGMSVQQVVDICGKPQEVRVFLDEEQQKKFNTDQFDAKIGYVDDFMSKSDPEKIKNGFVFLYQFSAAGIHQLYFTADGKYERQEEIPNLLNR